MDSDQITNKKYSVVQFISDMTYSEIPTTWLMKKGNKQLCWWPPRTANTAILIANSSSPNMESWNQYEVDIIKPCSSLESARKSAADANYQTTDEEKLGRGKRPHVSNSRFDNNSHSEYNNADDEIHEATKIQTFKIKKKKCNRVVSAMPLCPDNLNLNVNEFDIQSDNSEEDNNGLSSQAQYSIYKKNKSKNSQSDTRSLNIDEMEIVFEDNQSSTGEHNKVETDNNNLNPKNYLKQILQMQASTNLILREIKERINNIEDTMKIHALPSTNINYTLIAQFLPLDTINNIKEFESLMKNTEEAVVQFKQYLLKIGGNNPKDNIYRILSKIFTNNCAVNCSWKGIRNNFKVSNLYFIQIMRKEITLQHTGLTETQFDNIVAEWLRFAKQRKQRSEKAEKENIGE